MLKIFFWGERGGEVGSSRVIGVYVYVILKDNKNTSKTKKFQQLFLGCSSAIGAYVTGLWSNEPDVYQYIILWILAENIYQKSWNKFDTTSFQPLLLSANYQAWFYFIFEAVITWTSLIFKICSFDIFFFAFYFLSVRKKYFWKLCFAIFTKCKNC